MRTHAIDKFDTIISVRIFKINITNVNHNRSISLLCNTFNFKQLLHFTESCNV